MADIFKTDKERLDYVEWLNRPDTQKYLLAVEREGHLTRPHPTNCRAEVMLVAAGENIGWHGALQRLATLDKAPINQLEELVATYGAESLLKELGVKVNTNGKEQANGNG